MSLWWQVTGWGIIGVAKKKALDPYLPEPFETATDMGIGYLAAWKGIEGFNWKLSDGRWWSSRRQVKLVRTGKFYNPFRWGATQLGRGAHAGVRAGATGVRAMSVRGAAGFVGKARLPTVAVTTASYAGAVAVGYTIGAVAGTAVSGALFGKQGARHALEFYTGKGKYGEYFDIVGNFNTVFNALKQGDI